MESFKAFAREQLDENGLTEWGVEHAPDMKKALGKCNPRKKKIRLSKAWFEDMLELDVDFDLVEELKDVVLHEIAHALDFDRRGRSDHGRKWKSCALEVGADPTRTSKVPKKLIALVSPWKRECPRCGLEIFYQGKPRKSGYICPECEGCSEDVEQFILEEKRNDKNKL